MSHLNLTPPESPASKLRAQLAEGDIVVCPGVYDGFTARLALNAGFKTLYMVTNSYIEIGTEADAERKDRSRNDNVETRHG